MKLIKSEKLVKTALIIMTKSCLSLLLLLLLPEFLSGMSNNKYRFRIEIYGGFSTINATDFNQIVEYDEQVQNFFYETYYDFLLNQGEVSSWDSYGKADYNKVKNAFPFGFRFKYYLKESLAFSIGFKYVSRVGNSELEYKYSRTFSYYRDFEVKEYLPYSLSLKGGALIVGIHYGKKLSDRIEIEGYFTGGPLFAECTYLSEWSYKLDRMYSGATITRYESKGLLEERGSGTGLSVEAGLGIDLAVIHRFGLLFEFGYAYQVVSKISGPGREIQGGLTETWDGEWGMKEERIKTDWGELKALFPTNYWEGESEIQRIGDFKLALSGVQLRVGITYKF